MEICRDHSPQKLRRFRYRISHLSDSGWSFSSFGGLERIKKKFDAFTHKEYNNQKIVNAEHIANCQKKGFDLFHRNVKSRKIEKFFFPNDLLTLMEKDKNFYFGPNS